MSRQPTELEQIQRWMQSVITHPGGVSEGVSSDAAREHLNVPLDELETVIRRSQALESHQRLSIYVNAYYERLLECLREEYAVTMQALGEDLFDGLAFGYLQRYPSRSYTLGDLGAKFPQYLEETQLHAAEAPVGAPPSWPLFIVELAQFERMMREVSDGPGSEKLTAVDPAAIAARMEAIDEVRFVIDPSLRLAQFQHPLLAYWNGVKASESPAAPMPAACYLAVQRSHYTIYRHELEADEFALLSELVAGSSLDLGLSKLAARGQLAQLTERVGEWFGRWSREGYFLDVRES